MAAEIDFREGFDVEEVSPGKVRVSLDLSEVADQLPEAVHPDLAVHNDLGLATDTELAGGVATAEAYADTQDAVHVDAEDPHPGYLTPTEGNAAYDASGMAAAAQSAAETYAAAQGAAHVDAPDAHPIYQKESERGAPLGYATLDAGGQVPGSQLSEIAVDGGVVGFYGVTPIARAVMATGTGKTVDNIITALQNLGLFIQGGGGSGGAFDSGVFDTATFGVS